MGTKATLENVRTAHDQLIAEGEVPSANKVLERTGGSKTTVLKRLGEVQGGVPGGHDDTASAFLHEVAAPMLRRVWSAAKSQADAENKRQFESLLSVQEAQQQEIGTLRSALEQWQARAISAEEQLRSRDSHDEQVKELMRVIEGLKEVQTTAAADARPVEPMTGSALRTILEILVEHEAPLTKIALDRAVVDRGYADATVQKARFHALENGSIGFCITNRGRKKLSAPAAQERRHA